MWKAGIVVMFAATILGCQKANQPEMQSTTLAVAINPSCALVFIALKKDYFAREGLTVKPQMHTSGKGALKSVTEGKADLATVAETPVMLAVLNGEKIAIVANISTSGKNNAVIGRKDRGIAEPGDLRGKRLAVTLGTSGEFFMDSFLTANGIERKDVQTVGLKPEEIFDALVTGKVDAACTWNFYLTQLLKKLGDKGVIFFDKQIYTEMFNIVAQQDFLVQHPDTTKKFLRALLRADQFADEHPQETQEIVATALQVDYNLLRGIWPDFNFRVSLDQPLLVVLEDETRWAIRNHLTTASEMPNYLSHINIDALKAVKPAAVRIIR